MRGPFWQVTKRGTTVDHGGAWRLDLGPADTDILVDAPAAGPATPVEVSVLNMDILNAAHLVATHLPGPRRVLVRNMANPRTPGGGVRSGAGAQEEDLFRRSDLHRFLAACPTLYPLSEGTGLLSRGVTVFRGAEGQAFPLCGLSRSTC